MSPHPPLLGDKRTSSAPDPSAPARIGGARCGGCLVRLSTDFARGFPGTDTIFPCSAAVLQLFDFARYEITHLMELIAMETILVRFELSDERLAEEVADDLDLAGAEIKSRPKRGLVPVLPIVIGVLIAVAGLATIVQKIINGRKCRMIIDARTIEIISRVDCSIKDGRLIIITKDGEKVSVVDAPAAIDLTGLVTAATKGTVEEIKKIARESGAKVELT